MNKHMKTLCVTFTAVCALTACQKSPEQIAQEQAQAKEHSRMLTALVKLSSDECQTAPTAQLQRALANLNDSDLRILTDNKVTICADQRIDAQKGFGRNVYAIYYNTTAKKVASINSDPQGNIDFAQGILSSLPEIVRDKQDNANYYAGRFKIGNSRHTRWRGEGRFDSTLNANPELKTPPLKASLKPQW